MEKFFIYYIPLYSAVNIRKKSTHVSLTGFQPPAPAEPITQVPARRKDLRQDDQRDHQRDHQRYKDGGLFLQTSPPP